MRPLPLALFLMLTLAAEAHADEPLKGEGQLRDAVTVAVAGARVTLDGLAAPGAGACAGKDCTEAAIAALGPQLTGRTLSCTPDRRLGHGRYLGRCKLDDGTDVAILILEAGFAMPEKNAAPSYAAAAEKAKSEGRGLWAR